jgi:hypothetical protein
MGCGSSKMPAVAETTSTTIKEQQTDPKTTDATRVSSDRLRKQSDDAAPKEKDAAALTREELGYEPSNLPEADRTEEASTGNATSYFFDIFVVCAREIFR